MEWTLGSSYQSEEISNPAVATVSVAVVVFIQFGVVLRTRETLVAIWTLNGVRHNRPGSTWSPPRDEGPCAGAGEEWFAEIVARFRKLHWKTRLECLLRDCHRLNFIRRIGLNPDLTASSSQQIPSVEIFTCDAVTPAFVCQ